MTKPKLGPTGNFPDGSLNKDDAGELAIGVTTSQGNVVIIAFGTHVSWVGMPPDKAIAFAELIKMRAEELL